MSEQAANIDLIDALIAQQKRVRDERLSVKTKIATLQHRDQELRTREIALQNQIHDVRVRQLQIILPTSASPSPKNFDFLRAWTALHQAFTDSGPEMHLSRNQCVEVIRGAVPGIADATIRSHLHRLRKRGFIERVGGGLRLVQVHAEDPTIGTPRRARP